MKIWIKLFFVICIWSCQREKPDVVIEVDNTVINMMKGGFGASVHAMQDSVLVTKDRSYGGSAWGANPEPSDSVRWKQLFAHMDWLGMDWIRVELEHRMFQPEKKKFSFDNLEMQILYKYLDYCQSRGIDVFLQEMYPNVKWLTPPAWQNNTEMVILSAPSDLDAWSDGIVVLLEHLLVAKKYTCIKWFCVANEPMHGWSWWKQYPDKSSAPITPALKLLYEKINEKGLPVQLSGPDWSMEMGRDVKNEGYNYGPEKVDFANYVGAFDLHSYMSRPDWETIPFKWPTYKQSEQEVFLKNWTQFAHEQNKPFFLSEFGTFVYGFDKTTEKVTSYEALLNDIQTVIRGVNAGVDGFNKWSLLNRGDLDGKWQLINTWDAENHKILNVFTPRANNYYIYGLITRLSPQHADVLKTELTGGRKDSIQRVFACTLNDSGNNFSVFVLNDSEKTYSVNIKLPDQIKAMYKYTIYNKQSDKNNFQVNPEQVTTGLNSINDILSARSITVYSTYRLLHSDSGIIK